jgi:type II secretory pathway component PulF
MSKSLQYIFKYLSVYISASLDINSSIDLVCRRLKHKKLLKIFESVREKIRSGKSFKEAFSVLKDNRIIDGVTWSLISSAEYGGNIAGACQAISKHIEERAKTKSSLVGALAYPAGMFLASMCMTLFLITVAFPKITPLFKSMNAPIPTTTRYMLDLSYFISNWGMYAFVLLAGVALMLTHLYFKESAFKYKTQFVLLKVPVLSSILLYREYVNIASAIAILLKNHKTLEEAMDVAIEACSFAPVAAELRSILACVSSGQKISTAFDSAGKSGAAPVPALGLGFFSRRQSFFKEEWIDLISVGEITGSLPQSFSDVSSLYEIRYKDAIQILVRSSEPVALCCTAAVVLIIALSVITPMYSIIQQVQTQ